MGVYIKGINVSEFNHAWAALNIDDVAYVVKGENIIPVHDHGDLVDMDYIEKHWPNTQYFGAPVIIPAERSD